MRDVFSWQPVDAICVYCNPIGQWICFPTEGHLFPLAVASPSLSPTLFHPASCSMSFCIKTACCRFICSFSLKGSIRNQKDNTFIKMLITTRNTFKLLTFCDSLPLYFIMNKKNYIKLSIYFLKVIHFKKPEF